MAMHPITMEMQKDYQPPPIPVALPKFDGKASFGAEMKEKHFFLDVSVGV